LELADYNDPRGSGQYASPSVYAKRSCAAGDPCDLLRLLHGPHQVGLRLVIILLSQQGWTAAAIAQVLGCDPRTVRRWVHRYNQQGTSGLADWPRSGRPRLGSRRLHARRDYATRPFTTPYGATLDRATHLGGCAGT
jgi:hypothetical protein